MSTMLLNTHNSDFCLSVILMIQIVLVSAKLDYDNDKQSSG